MNMSNLLGRTLGSYVVSPIVENVDVDEVIRRVDVNDVVARIDVEAVLDRIDMNRLLNRLDLNVLLERVDMEQLVERTNLEYIIARSSASICDSAISSVRAVLVQVDQWIQSCGRCSCCRQTRLLPPRPGKSRRKDRVAPKERVHLAVALQGRYAGGTLQFMAWGLDQLVLLFGSNGRTVGLALYGLKVVNSGNGDKIDLFRAVIRTATFPLSVASIVGIAIMWIRRDGRSLPDLIAGTGTIYSWDARMALMRAKASSVRRGQYRDAVASLDNVELTSAVDAPSHL